MPKRKAPAPPPNLAARALREGQFQAKVVKDPRTYTRKVKHKKGSAQYEAPHFVASTTDGDSVNPNEGAQAMIGIDHINIKARDMDAMCEFLIGVLGLERGYRPDFDFPGHWLYLNGEPIIHMMLRESESDGGGWIDHLAFGPFDFDEQVARLDAGGFEYGVGGIPGTGIRQLFVAGPEGAKIELQCHE